MSDLSQRVKTWAKDGAILGVTANAVMTLALVVIPDGREFIIKDPGIPTYIAILAGGDVALSLFNIGFETAAYYGGKAIDKTVAYIRNR